MNKYTELSDFEINKKVAGLFLNKEHYEIDSYRQEVMYFKYGSDRGLYRDYDPCKNPPDAMPIIIENNIDLLNGENMMPELFGHHSAYTLHNFNTPIAADSIKEDKTIYRLGMEVFLMKKDAENENNNNS